ncbi:hypothetical protein H696_02168 [Fonticula alba]|uniref:Peptidase M14 domain-containing protein n=1 Tax=Fonticula alba TaxID=691883 RepID=A0A058ZCQ3_FONAL|nr:hypothetical protein H696_02168 [Fonticula alba]KCV71217.1 hypothetical protein H696_02168 [Fonticula alba]|eukprot:XP_009494340.1 hypothetical protein H696_02168 [Fonticula alba]
MIGRFSVGLLLSLLFALASAEQLLVPGASIPERSVRYDNEQIIRCSSSALAPAALEALITRHGVDIWGATGEHVDLRITEQTAASRAVRHMVVDNTECRVIVHDVERLVASAERVQTAAAVRSAAQRGDGEDAAAAGPVPAGWFDAYHDFDSTRTFYQNLAQSYPDMATFLPSIGKTHESRSIFGLVLGGSNSTASAIYDQPELLDEHGIPLEEVFAERAASEDLAAAKPSIFFQCSIHAREWISNAVCQYVLSTLLDSHSRRVPAVVELFDRYNLYVIPITNPDGYAHTWSGDRMWRKNRVPNAGSTCRGVDVNRNYNDHWGQGGSSNLPCSDTYMGTAANSELETRASIAFFRSASPVHLAIDWHAYSQLILRPYGWSTSDSPHEARLKQIGAAMQAAIRNTHGMSYTNQKSIELYPTTGTASDWFYGSEATRYNGGFRSAGYTIELRDTGRYGFLLPPEQILPTGEESYAAVLAMARDLLDNGPMYA